MKIAILKSRLSFRGGLEKYTLKLASHFAKKNNQVTILTTSNEKKGEAINHVKVIPLSRSSKFTFYHLLKFNFLCKKWLNTHKSDIVFGMERNLFQTHLRLGNGVHAVFLKRRMQTETPLKKLSLVLNPLQYYLLYLEKRAIENRSLKRLFVNSHMVHDEVLQYYSIPPSKIEVVYNGVAWKELEKPFLEQFTRPKRLELLFIGNGYKRKGLHQLFPALAKVKDKDFHLSIVGKEKNIPFYKKLASKYAIEDKVTFFGPQKEVIPFYQKADILVLPTLYDPFANVTLEALAMGLFVVTSLFNGGKEVLTSESGVVIEDLFDVESVKKALLIAFNYSKTYERALSIRNTIKHLEFSTQLDKIVEKSLM